MEEAFHFNDELFSTLQRVSTMDTAEQRAFSCFTLRTSCTLRENNLTAFLAEGLVRR